MTLMRPIGRRPALAGAVALLAAPAVLRSVRAATRGVSAMEIVIGCMADLSGVTAVQGVNNADAMRLAFEEVNERGGVHGRKIRFVLEDMQYQVPKAVQAMNKLLNSDSVFCCVGNGGTPMNNAVLPEMIDKQVVNLFPTTCARSMYEPFNRYKFGQFASYYDQMRAGVKHFVEQRGRKRIGAMYQDTDFGKDVLAGAVAQVEAMGMQLVATTAHKPTDTDFNAAIARLRDAGCDMIATGTIVRDTTLILQTARKAGWNPDFVGAYASYSTAVAEAPGGATEGYYSMAPALYRYPDDPRPAVRAITSRFQKAYGIEMNYLGQSGYVGALFAIDALQRAGRDLTVDSFIAALEGTHDWRDPFDGPLLSLSPSNHHASNQSFLSVVKNGRWTPVTEDALSF